MFNGFKKLFQRSASVGLAGIMAASVGALPLRAQSSASEPKDPVVLYSKTGVEGLAGTRDYKLEPSKTSLTTLWNATGINYGRVGMDSYMFTDISNDGGRYFEGLWRLSGSRLTGKKLSFGPVKDFVGAVNVEAPQGLAPRWLYGGGANWAAPGFAFLKTDLYARDDRAQKGKTGQFTIIWQTKDWHKLSSNGFADFSGHEGTSSANIISQPRAMFRLVSGKHAAVLIGGEIDLRKNKFGVRGVNEINPQGLVVLEFSK